MTNPYAPHHVYIRWNSGKIENLRHKNKAAAEETARRHMKLLGVSLQELEVREGRPEAWQN